MMPGTSFDIETVVRSNPRLLQALRGLVRGYVRARGFAPGEVDNIVLAVDEACANAIRHAYNGRTDAEIRIRLGEEDSHLVIEVGDDGNPCPDSVKEKDLTEPPPDARDLRPGGLGIPLMREVFDSVEFDTGGTQGNRVRLRLRYPENWSG